MLSALVGSERAVRPRISLLRRHGIRSGSGRQALQWARARVAFARILHTSLGFFMANGGTGPARRGAGLCYSQPMIQAQAPARPTHVTDSQASCPAANSLPWADHRSMTTIPTDRTVQLARRGCFEKKALKAFMSATSVPAPPSANPKAPSARLGWRSRLSTLAPKSFPGHRNCR